MLADAGSGLSPGRVPVHHDDEVRYWEQKLVLSRGEMSAKECDGGDGDLVEPHDPPWALDKDESLRIVCSDPVKVVEQPIFGEPWGKFPFAVAPDIAELEMSSGVPHGTTLGIMEPDPDGSLEKPSSSIQSDLEVSCSFGMDGLATEQICLGVEWNVALEGYKGPG